MATAAFQRYNLQYIQCSICIDVVSDPRSLPGCYHTFCFKCIADWYKKHEQPGNKVACPQCGRECAIPDSGIDDLEKDDSIRRQLKFHEIHQKSKQLCEICVEKNRKVTISFCLQCEQSYCKSCSSAHSRMKISSSHNLVSLEELSRVDENKKIFCDIHEDELIKMYCLDDEVAICVMCCFNDHRSHQCEEIEKVADRFNVRRQEKIQPAMDTLEECLETMNSKKMIFLDQVNNVEAEILQMIDNEKQKVITELQLIKHKHEQELSRLIETINLKKSCMTEFIVYCDQLLREGAYAELCREETRFQHATEIHTETEYYEKVVRKFGVTNVMFSPSRVKCDENKSILGQVKTEIIPTEVAHTLVNNANIITAIELLSMSNEMLLLLAYRDVGHVSVYKVDRGKNEIELQRNISIPTDPVPLEMSKEYGFDILAARANEGNRSEPTFLFAKRCYGTCIHTVDLSTDEVTQWKVPGDPIALSRSLMPDNEQTIIVIVRTGLVNGKVINAVRKYSPTGTLIKELSHDNQLRRAFEIRRGTLIVDCCGPERGIAELSWDGDVLHCYDIGFGQCPVKQSHLFFQIGFGQRPGQQSYSFSMSTKGNVVIVYMGNGKPKIEIVEVDYKNHWSSKFVQKTLITFQLPVDIDLQKSVAVCYDEMYSYRLFVGENSGKKRLVLFHHATRD